MRHKHPRTLPLLLSAPLLASASFLSSLQPRSLLSSTLSLASNSSSSTNGVTTVSTTGTYSGRFGHSSVYLSPPVNKLLIIGGQLDSSTNSSESGSIEVTNEVLEFNVAGSYLWGEEREGSAIPDNPWAPSSLSLGEGEGSAFMGSGMDGDDELVWLIGGIKSGDCDGDVAIRSFNFSSLSSPSSSSSDSNGSSAWTTNSTFLPRLPPRRRQASMVPIKNLTTLSTDLWVFGGIADEYSCSTSSQGTVGYEGIDRYSPKLGTVESFAWEKPINLNESEEWKGNPISDYSVEVLGDGTSVVILGGQTSEGEFVGLENVLVFNVELREWYTKITAGPAPSPRMGHISLSLSSSNSSSILLHGGLSPNHTLLSDLWLLTPPSLTVLSSFSDAEDPKEDWEWKELKISNESMSPPGLAYHAASEIVGGTIVVSFGLTDADEQGGEVSNKFWFLTINEEEGTFTWKDTFNGNEQQVEQTLAEKTIGG
ncbi:uncharacterized protein JCM6883_000064 [Sporobolomyces salmoneus]|uniref:uncharacterized protein n=1 Tax=Sporobolomyces salmoneus TaxID=183962 RepID=UPI003179B303